MVWSRISQVFTFGSQWGDNTVRLVEGDNALAMIRRVEGILEDASRMLNSHERVMSSGEFNVFSIKHRHLVLKVIEVKGEVRRQQQQGVFSATPAGRGSDRIARDVVRLTNQAEIYHQDLLTASRRAQIAEEQSFLNRHRLDVPQTESSGNPPAGVYSITSSTHSTGVELGSEVGTLVDHQPHLTILYTRPDAPTDDDSIREIYAVEHHGRTLITYTTHTSADELSDPSNDALHIDMVHACRDMVLAPDLSKLQGYEVTKASEQDTSWVDSFVNGLARLGAGAGADMM